MPMLTKHSDRVKKTDIMIGQACIWHTPSRAIIIAKEMGSCQKKKRKKRKGRQLSLGALIHMGRGRTGMSTVSRKWAQCRVDKTLMPTVFSSNALSSIFFVPTNDISTHPVLQTVPQLHKNFG